ELIEEDGKVLAQWPPPFAVSPEPASLPPVAAASLRSDHPEISPVQFGPAGTAPEMAVAVSLRGPAGADASKGRRILVATLSLEMLSQLLTPPLGDEQSAPIYVMTGDGRVLAHSEIGTIGKKLSLPSGGVTKRIL